MTKVSIPAKHFRRGIVFGAAHGDGSIEIGLRLRDIRLGGVAATPETRVLTAFLRKFRFFR
jgi:hypothetical protein